MFAYIICSFRPYQVRPVRVRIDLGAITIEGYFTFPKFPMMEPFHEIVFVINRILGRGVLLPNGDAFGVFYSSPADWAGGIQSSSSLLLLPRPLCPGVVLFTNPSAWEGYDTRSIFKRSLTGLNSEFSFS